MTRAVKSSALVIASLWVGALFCLGFVVAPYLFALAARRSPAVPDTGVAAALIGPLLYSADVVGLVVGAGLLLALAFLRRRGEVPLGGRLYLGESGVAAAALCAAVNYWVLTPRLRAIQGRLAERYGAFHQAGKADPLFRQFSGLHQASTTVFLVGFVAALIGLVCMTQFRTRAAAPGVA
jgi:hypothetical protein